MGRLATGSHNEPETTRSRPRGGEQAARTAQRGRRLPLAAPSTPGRARDTLRLRVYGALARGLMGGMFTPGEAVSLRTLAARLGTSAMPVREAVSRLIAERALVSCRTAR